MRSQSKLGDIKFLGAILLIGFVMGCGSDKSVTTLNDVAADEHEDVPHNSSGKAQRFSEAAKNPHGPSTGYQVGALEFSDIDSNQMADLRRQQRQLEVKHPKVAQGNALLGRNLHSASYSVTKDFKVRAVIKIVNASSDQPLSFVDLLVSKPKNLVTVELEGVWDPIQAVAQLKETAATGRDAYQFVADWTCGDLKADISDCRRAQLKLSQVMNGQACKTVYVSLTRDSVYPQVKGEQAAHFEIVRKHFGGWEQQPLYYFWAGLEDYKQEVGLCVNQQSWRKRGSLAWANAEITSFSVAGGVSKARLKIEDLRKQKLELEFPLVSSSAKMNAQIIKDLNGELLAAHLMELDANSQMPSLKLRLEMAKGQQGSTFGLNSLDVDITYGSNYEGVPACTPVFNSASR